MINDIRIYLFEFLLINVLYYLLPNTKEGNTWKLGILDIVKQQLKEICNEDVQAK